MEKDAVMTETFLPDSVWKIWNSAVPRAQDWAEGIGVVYTYCEMLDRKDQFLASDVSAIHGTDDKVRLWINRQWMKMQIFIILLIWDDKRADALKAQWQREKRSLTRETEGRRETGNGHSKWTQIKDMTAIRKGRKGTKTGRVKCGEVHLGGA